MDEEAIFLEALQRATPAARVAFLDDACAGNPSLRGEVEMLLKAHEKAGRFLQGQPAGLCPTVDQPIAEKPGTQIGPYKLLQQIGEGGMGVVYMAEQQEPVARRVALKIIKPGMDTRQVITRFEAERQALAMMDHPNIAKVFDAGTTDSGRPYFVMELVNGIPVTQFCDQQHLTARERLELFIPICQAVQHAHQKGVIHRDIKPSNILIALYDSCPVPKVIDFGVAKAISQKLTEKTVFTGLGQIVGTLEYMSPEQAQRNQLDIDTRSDVYSLGVVLYELLTGDTPFDKRRLRSSAWDEMLRIIREEEPPKPSTKLSSSEILASVAANRKIDPTKLSALVRGELDWIVMKALEKDRTRRYETASGLAADIQHYLHDEPVQACPPSTAYRIKKFARRNKAALATASVVLLSLIAVLVAFSWSSLAARDAAESEHELAERQLRIQRGISDALTEATRLRGQSAGVTGGGSVSTLARDHVLRAVALAASGPADPQLVAQVRQLADELDQEQRDRELLASLDKAWLARLDTDVRENRFLREAGLPIMREALTRYGIAVGVGSTEQLAAAIRAKQEPLRGQLLTALDEWRSLAPPIVGISFRSEADRILVVESILPGSPADRDGRLKTGDQIVGVGQGQEGQIVDVRPKTMPEGLALVRGASGTIVRLQVIPQGETEPRIFAIQRDPTAAWIGAIVDAADADPWRKRFREACDLMDDNERRAALRKLAEEADVARQPVRVLDRLGGRLAELNDLDLALVFLRNVWQRHPADVGINSTLAQTAKENNNWEEVVRYCTAAIALRPDSAGLHLNLGLALNEQGKRQEAIAQYREALRLRPEYSMAHSNLGGVLCDQGKVEEGIAEFREAIRLKPDLAALHDNLGNALCDQGKVEEGIAEYREAIRLKPDDAMAHYGLGNILLNQGNLKEAIAEYREAIRLKPDYAEAHDNLGNVLGDQGKVEEAIAEHREAIRLKPDLANAHYNLGIALCGQGKVEEGISEYREAIRLKPDYAEAHNNLALLLATAADPQWRQPAEAVKLAAKVVELGPKNGDFWNTLGVPRYRNGQSSEAIDALTKAMDLRSGGDANEWLFLAMSHWQLDQKDEARKWYDRAVVWMKEKASDDAELLRFRAEAG